MMAAGAITQTVLEIIIPGAGSAVDVLTKIYDACKDLKEAKESCKQLHDRLRIVLDELERMASANQIPPGKAIVTFRDALTRYWNDLAQFKDMRLIERMLRHKKLKETIVAVNEDVDDLFQMLNLATTGVIMAWREQWERDSAQQLEFMVKLVEDGAAIRNEVREVKVQLDMLLLLRSTVNTMDQNTNQSPEMHSVIKDTLDVVVRASTVDTPDVPAWFIAEASITYSSSAFATGAFGSVHRGTWTDNTRVVVKLLLPDEKGLTRQLQTSFTREADIWYTFKHPHIVKMFGACHVASKPFIVCEEALNGNLADYLGLSETNKMHMWRLLYEASLGLGHLHSLKIAHGDLKLNNILVGSDLMAKVADFGLSQVKNKSKSQSMTRLKSGQLAGGLRWMAPERFERTPQLISDVYALAMCIIEAATGEPPYAYLDDDESVREKIRNGVLPERPDNMEDDAWQLVVEMAAHDHRQRLPLKRVIPKLKELAQREERERHKSVHVCACGAKPSSGSRFCHKCGTSLTGEGGGGAVLSSSASVVLLAVGPQAIEDLVSALDNQTATVKAKTTAVKQLYRRIAELRTYLDTSDRDRVLKPLQTAASNGEKNVPLALYAYGCLSELTESSHGLTDDILEEVRTQVDDKITASEAKDIILKWLGSDNATTRDERQAAELTELLVRLDKRNQNALGETIPKLAQVLTTASFENEVRDVVLSALAALTAGHAGNVSTLREFKASLEASQETSLEASLLAVLATATGDAKPKQHAADLLVTLTESVSSANECATADGVCTLVALLVGRSELKERATRILGKIAEIEGARELVGTCGAIRALVQLLSSTQPGGDNTCKRLAFTALSLLVTDPLNGSMFQQAQGIQATRNLLLEHEKDRNQANTQRLLWDLATLLKNTQLRKAVASDATILDACLEFFAQEDPAQPTDSALVLSELVRGNTSVVRAIRNKDGLLKKLVDRKDEYSSMAIINAVETLLDALPVTTASPKQLSELAHVNTTGAAAHAG